MRKVLPVTVFAAVILLVVVLNIVMSQLYPSLMFEIVELRDPDATQQFLAHIEKTPEYPQQYQYFNGVFNNAFAYEDIQSEFSLQSEVKRYATLLEKNERNHQAMVQIALLYYDQGNVEQARQYYAKAKEINPWIDIDELEALL